MQLKLNRQKSLGQSLAIRVIKFIFFIIFLIGLIFLLEKVDFPSPNKKFNIDISNEIIKLK
tara:strand:- start:450 stop:632 length:183 start_codon:yes stop_codon:yes gene_type:complete